MSDQDRETRIDEDVEAHAAKGAAKGQVKGREDENDVEGHSHYAPHKGAPHKGAEDEGDENRQRSRDPDGGRQQHATAVANRSQQRIEPGYGSFDATLVGESLRRAADEPVQACRCRHGSARSRCGLH